MPVPPNPRLAAFLKFVFLIYIFSLVFHSMGFSLLPKPVVDLFSSFGFYNDVLLLRMIPSKHDTAEAYAGHMILSTLYMVPAIALFAIVAVRDVLARIKLLPRHCAMPYSLIAISALLIAVGCYFIFSTSHSSFANDDRRFRGMPIWWVMSMTTFMWPSIFTVLSCALVNPKYTRENWKI